MKRCDIFAGALILLVSACQTPPDTAQAAKSMEQTGLGSTSMTEKNSGYVFVHGCGSRSMGLTFDLKTMRAALDARPDAHEFSDLLPDLCFLSK